VNRVQTALMWRCRVKTVLFIKLFRVWCWMSTKVLVLVSRLEVQGLGLDLKTWWPRSRSWSQDLKKVLTTTMHCSIIIGLFHGYQKGQKNMVFSTVLADLFGIGCTAGLYCETCTLLYVSRYKKKQKNGRIKCV